MFFWFGVLRWAPDRPRRWLRSSLATPKSPGVASESVPLHFKGHGQTGRDASTPRLEGALAILETDTQTDMLLREPRSAICVQRFDDSLNSAIHTTYRTWLRSSSMHEPRDPPLKVLSFFRFSRQRFVSL